MTDRSGLAADCQATAPRHQFVAHVIVQQSKRLGPSREQRRLIRLARIDSDFGVIL
jgi:hypothetical protein